MSTAQNHLSDTILRAVRAQARAGVTRLEDIPRELLGQIRVEAAASERKRHATSSLFAKAIRAAQRGR
jgi:hypothetical protein